MQLYQLYGHFVRDRAKLAGHISPPVWRSAGTTMSFLGHRAQGAPEGVEDQSQDLPAHRGCRACAPRKNSCRGATSVLPQRSGGQLPPPRHGRGVRGRTARSPSLRPGDEGEGTAVPLLHAVYSSWKIAPLRWPSQQLRGLPLPCRLRSECCPARCWGKRRNVASVQNGPRRPASCRRLHRRQQPRRRAVPRSGPTPPLPVRRGSPSQRPVGPKKQAIWYRPSRPSSHAQRRSSVAWSSQRRPPQAFFFS